MLASAGYDRDVDATVSRTAEYVALYRALETTETRRDPLFRDPLARAFLSRRHSLILRLAKVPSLRAVIQRYADWRAPGARTSAIARTCFIDDVVRDSVRDGVGQLVVLGAGYDCRAHRMPELSGVDVFEVDRRETQTAKRARLGPPAGDLDRLRYVAVDFTRDDLASRLASSGWERGAPSLFVWEGVTNYLNEDAVARVLGLVGGAAPGTTIVFTYIHAGVLDGSTPFEAAPKLLRNVRRLGEPWTFGLRPDDVSAFVARFNLTLEQDDGADDYRRRYLGAAAHPRELRGYAFYRIAVARTRVA